MRFLTNRFKTVSLVLAAMAFAVVTLLTAVPARMESQDDPAAFYKSKCVACHGAAASKKFDATKPDDDLIQVVLKGKKLEKPPNMPNYEEKGVSADQARALVTFMKSQKQ